MKLTKTAHYISTKIGKAIGDYDLIRKNDKILVAVSGGKDSLTMLKLLKERERWSPVKYKIVAAHIKTDFTCSMCSNSNALKKIFKDMQVEHVFKKIKVLDKNNKTTCFWCSWNRRKALFEIANSLKCNKVALGHHKDDIIETTLLNMLFQGEFSSMNPRQELFKGKIVIIRPLCYVYEKLTEKFAKENGFHSQICQCLNSRDSRRKYIKDFIADIEKKTVGVKTNIFNSAARINQEYLKLKKES